jgi:DNA-binding Lrp family transcriptional regulator
MLKPSDMKFIAELRQNARQTLTEISKKTKIPISTLYDKLKLHEGSVIAKHTTILDFSKLGYNCRANVMLKANREDKEALCSYLKAHPSVNNLFKVNNGYDYMAEFIFPNVKEMEEFMEELEQKFKLEARQTNYIIDEMRREEFLAAER